MARRGDVLGVTGADTVIGTGVVAKGSLTSDGDIIIDGTVSGNVSATGDVSLGVNAIVKGNIRGQNVTVSGALDGNIAAIGEVTLHETGRITGDISAISLAISSGGIFMGHSRMQLPPKLGPADDNL